MNAHAHTHIRKYWTAYSGWAAIAVVLITAFSVWNVERGELRAEVQAIKDAREIRNKNVDGYIRRSEKQQRKQGKAITRIDERSLAAQRERKEIKDLIHGIARQIRNRTQ